MSKNPKKKILVTGIGGDVGQAIIKNIRLFFPSFIIIGTNTSKITNGNFLCDYVIQICRGDSENYITELNRIIHEYSVDLVIASTDLENYILAKNKGQVKTQVACIDWESAKHLFDKYKTYLLFESLNIQFAKSYLPSRYSNEFDSVILKPRTGRGSRNIIRNPQNPKEFSDDFVIQELLKGEEITSGCYIGKNNDYFGSISFRRQLQKGTTILCEVVRDFDDQINSMVERIKSKMDLTGSFNIQSIIVDGIPIPFEINARISGTNYIRAHFGFTDVKFLVDELLFNKEIFVPKIKNGSAMRYYTEVIFNDTKLSDITNNKIDFYKTY